MLIKVPRTNSPQETMNTLKKTPRNSTPDTNTKPSTTNPQPPPDPVPQEQPTVSTHL